MDAEITEIVSKFIKYLGGKELKSSLKLRNEDLAILLSSKNTKQYLLQLNRNRELLLLNMFV